MRYQVITSDSEKCSEQLQVIGVDTHRQWVKVRTTSDDVKVAHQQLNSEDAKTLALRAAVKAGAVQPILKHTTVVFGDDKTGAIQSFSAVHKTTPRPFLVVEFDSEDGADMNFSGDSL